MKIVIEIPDDEYETHYNVIEKGLDNFHCNWLAEVKCTVHYEDWKK